MSDIEYFYGANSAFAYLGASRLMEIAQAAGRRITHKPVNLGAVVAAAHPQGFADRSPAHRAYYFAREIERWAEYRGVSVKGGIPSNHRNDTTLANSMLIAAAMQDKNADQLALAMMQAHWRDHADLSDQDVLVELAKSVELDAKVLLEAAKAPEITAILAANTADAIERSVFGSPTYIVEGDMFYGQDHLELVERALRRPFGRTWS